MSSIQQELINFDFPTALEEALGLNAQARNSLFELFEEAMEADLNPEQASVSLIKSLDEALLNQAYQNKYGDFEDRQLCAQSLAYWVKFRQALLKEAMHLLQEGEQTNPDRDAARDALKLGATGHGVYITPQAAPLPKSQSFQPTGVSKSPPAAKGFNPSLQSKGPVQAPAKQPFQPSPSQARPAGFNPANRPEQQQPAPQPTANRPVQSTAPAPVFNFGAPKG